MALSLVSVRTGDDTTSVAIPTTAAVGDLFILVDSCSQTSSITTVVPANYTELVTNYSNSQVGTLRYKTTISRRILPVAGSANVTGMPSTAGTVIKVGLLFRPERGITSVTYNDNSFQVVSAVNLTTQIVSASNATTSAIVMAQWRTQNTAVITSALFTATPDVTVAVASGHTFKSVLYNTSPINVSAGMPTITGTTSFYCMETNYITVAERSNASDFMPFFQ
jgi:hypothetical protein